MRNISLLVLLLCFTFQMFASESDYLKRGVFSYQNSDFENALNYFLSAKSAGLNNPDLLFNIGNTYYRLNDIPNAIVYYKRALLLDSSYKPAISNLEFLMSITQDEQSQEETFLSSFIKKIIFMFTINTLFLIVLFLLLMITLFIHLQWMINSGKLKIFIDKHILRFINVVLTTVLFIVFSFAVIRLSYAKNFNEAVVKNKNVYVYSGPAESFTRLFTVHSGTVIRVHKEDSEWSQISTLNGFNGWIPSNTYIKVKE